MGPVSSRRPSEHRRRYRRRHCMHNKYSLLGVGSVLVLCLLVSAVSVVLSASPGHAAAADADADDNVYSFAFGYTERAMESPSPPSSSSPCHASPLIVPKTVTSRRSSKLVIAHRGASAHVPEHSLAAYRLAYELGADYAEPDLVATKDGNLVAVHSMDLNITTNVANVFPDRLTTSKFYDNRTGYWTYDFTVPELKQLRIKQRLPEARTTVYDGLFQIPTLTELLELLREWNTEIAPTRHAAGGGADTGDNDNDGDKTNIPQPQQPPRVGIYAELKDTVWLREDTGVDLVELLFQHYENNVALWNSVIGGDHSCKAHRLTDYLVPPLVLQSFDGKALRSVATQWAARINRPVGTNTTSKNTPTNTDAATTPTPIPIPPLVILVGKDKCRKETFWYQVDQSWRDILSGVGPDKECVLDDESESNYFLEHAAMLGLAVHPWTIRPEVEYHFGYPTAYDELVDLFCHDHHHHDSKHKTQQHHNNPSHFVHGVFSEAVSDAILAATVCQEYEAYEDYDLVLTNNGYKSSNACDESSPSSSSSSFRMTLGGFVLAMSVGGLIGGLLMRFLFPVLRLRLSRYLNDSSPIPTTALSDIPDDDNHDDHEML